MSARDDIAAACLSALRSGGFPPTEGQLELLRRAAWLPDPDTEESPRSIDLTARPNAA